MAICNEVSVLAVGLLIAAMSILCSSASRDLLDSFLAQVTPVNEKALSGWYVVMYRALYLVLLVSILIVLTILLL